MVRSQKRSVKKVEVAKEIDPEKLAFLAYLGDLEEDLNAAQKWGDNYRDEKSLYNGLVVVALTFYLPFYLHLTNKNKTNIFLLFCN